MAATDDQWLQSLFLFHIVFAVFSGGIAVVFPSFWHGQACCCLTRPARTPR